MTSKPRHGLLSLLLAALATPAARAATLPSGFTETVVASGISSPTAMALAPDGRIFVCEQGGALRVIKNGSLLATPFLTVSVNSSGERGLLGVAFDPDFPTNQYVYVYYTTSTSPIHNRVSRFTANGDVAVAGSEIQILNLENLSATNHNGGAIHFGPDGKLYVAAGENAVGSNSQSLTNRLGKVLRLNSDGTVPSDNPFYLSASGDNRAIWALGLRNPFTFAFQPGTGRLFINDVGQNTYEEINDGVAGANYGWPTSEGPSNCTMSGFTCPLYYYDHSQGCAITGGTFYNPTTASFPPEYTGKYFFSEYCGNWIKTIDPNAPPAPGAAPTFATGYSAPVDLFVSPAGDLYVLPRNAGQVVRISYTGSLAPSISQHPASQTVTVGATAAFTVAASGTPPLSYQWQRDHADIPGANGTTFSLQNAQLSDSGAAFRCVVSNAAGSATSNDATLTVTPNTPPTAAITAPAQGSFYSGGETISYSGTGTDAEDVTIPASGFTWWIDFHHDDHTHPAMLPTSGATGGQFTVPNTGETSANVFYRFHLRVTDSGGLTHETTRDVLPRTAQVTLATTPAGLQLTLDGQPLTAPFTFTGVQGMLRSIGAPTPQTSGGSTYDFVSWSDGGALTHTITTPTADTTYTASFSNTPPSGDGLLGTYFDNRDLTNQKLVRVDPTVNFSWGTGSPAPGIAADTFSVRWTGFVQPQFTQTYTFYVNADEGARLYVNGQLLFDRYSSRPGREASGTISLVGGQKYAVVLEYNENKKTASVVFSWSSPGQPKQVVPQLRMYSQ